MFSDYVAAYGAWSPTEMEFFADLLPEHADVIEVGANIGMHTVPWPGIAEKDKLSPTNLRDPSTTRLPRTLPSTIA
jgi:hypothetical protein